MKIKHRITYDIKGSNNQIRVCSKDFNTFDEACTFIREIKTVAVSKPLIEEVPVK